MLVGVYGLIFEFMNPGLVAARRGRRDRLLLALYALHLLPVNYAGLALILLGIGFMVAEAFVPAYGALGIGGVIAFVIGSVMLIDTDVPGFGIPLRSSRRRRCVSAAFLIVVAGMAAQGAPAAGGQRPRALVGARGEVLDDSRQRRLGARAAASPGACAPARRCARGAARARRRAIAGPHARRRARRRNRQEARTHDHAVFGFGGLVVLLVLVAIRRCASCASTSAAWCSSSAASGGVKGPGLILLDPGVQQMVRVDLRTVVLDVPRQDVISRDNVSVKVNAVLYFRVVDPRAGGDPGRELPRATSQLAQTTLRSVLGKHELDEMLAEREKLNIDIQQILDAQTDAWGIKVANVEIKHVDLNETMIRAIARQAEAERERRAKVIHAEGELQAAQKLLEAARDPRAASRRRCSCATCRR